MRKLLFLTAAVFLLSLPAFAQDNKASFSGTWKLEASKSKLDERARIESMTMTVTQTDKELKVETATKRLPPPADAPQGGPGGRGGGMGRGGFGGGDGTSVYSLDGKETTVQQESPMGSIPVKLKASKESDGSLKLSSSRTISGQMGEMTITTKEKWSLSSDGKTLTVERDQSTPRGTNSSTMVFVKN